MFDKIFEQQKKEFESGRFGHAYLILSDDASSGEAYVSHLASFLVCESHLPCLACEHCVKVQKGSHPDVLVFPKEKNIAVEDAGKIVNESVIKPMLSPLKIFILKNFDLATPQSQNKLLKLFEEPPKNVIFLLSAVSEQKILKTVLSRMKKISLSNTKNLVEKDGYNTFYEEITALLTKMKTSKDVVKFSTKFSEIKEDFVLKLEILNNIFGSFLEGTPALELKEVQKEYSQEAIVRILEEIKNAKRKRDSNVNINIITDHLFLKILEVKYLCK